MSQRSIEIIVGRLVTDEGFREAFLDDPRRTLEGLSEAGVQLTDLEMRALIGTSSGFWSRVADELDPRLQKAALQGGPERR